MVEQQRHITEIHEQVRKHLQSSAEMQQRGQIQGGLKMREFKIGEQVWWYFPATANQKLRYPWTGPFEVTDVAKDRNTAISKDTDAILGSMPHHLNQS